MANSRMWFRVSLAVGIGTIAVVAAQSTIATFIDGWQLILLGAIGAVGIMIVFNSQQPALADEEADLPLDRDRLKQELQKTDQLINKISDPTSRDELNQRAQKIATSLDQHQFRITVFGTGSSGKTSVINALLGREAGNTAATIGTTTTQQEYPYEAALTVFVNKAEATELETGVNTAAISSQATNAIATTNTIDHASQAVEPLPTKSNQQSSYQAAQVAKKNKATKSINSKRQILLIDTPGLQEVGADGLSRELEASKLAQAADLLIFVSDGDLSDSEYQQLVQLCQLGKRVILAFNKTDRYLAVDRQLILAKLKARTAKFLKPEDVVAISACPAPIKVRQYNANAQDHLSASDRLNHHNNQAVSEWLESLPVEIAPLQQRIEQILSIEQEQLVCANARLQIKLLQKSARVILRDLRRSAAEKIISRYQWLSASAVFANPLPGLDLVAGAAINTQLIIELARLYEQKFNLRQARKTATIIAELLLKLGSVEVITTAIATFLKANAITYAIGGSVQAISVAYLTRVGGMSFLDYLEQQEQTKTQPKAKNEPMLKALHRYCQSNLRKMQGEVFVTDFIKVAVATLSGSEKTANHNSN
jgi:GTPase SAR1 family protein